MTISVAAWFHLSFLRKGPVMINFRWLKAGLLGLGITLMVCLTGIPEQSVLADGAKTSDKSEVGQKHTRSPAYVWLDIALEAMAREHERNTPRPSIGSRMMAIICTAMYDAWAAYDDKA